VSRGTCHVGVTFETINYSRQWRLKNNSILAVIYLLNLSISCVAIQLSWPWSRRGTPWKREPSWRLSASSWGHRSCNMQSGWLVDCLSKCRRGGFDICWSQCNISKWGWQLYQARSRILWDTPDEYAWSTNTMIAFMTDTDCNRYSISTYIYDRSRDYSSVFVGTSAINPHRDNVDVKHVWFIPVNQWSMAVDERFKPGSNNDIRVTIIVLTTTHWYSHLTDMSTSLFCSDCPLCLVDPMTSDLPMTLQVHHSHLFGFTYFVHLVILYWWVKLFANLKLLVETERMSDDGPLNLTTVKSLTSRISSTM